MDSGEGVDAAAAAIGWNSDIWANGSVITWIKADVAEAGFKVNINVNVFSNNVMANIDDVEAKMEAEGEANMEADSDIKAVGDLAIGLAEAVVNIDEDVVADEANVVVGIV